MIGADDAIHGIETEVTVATATVTPVHTHVAIGVVAVEHEAVESSGAIILGATGVQHRVAGADLAIHHLTPLGVVVVVGLRIILVAIILRIIAEVVNQSVGSVVQICATDIDAVCHVGSHATMVHERSDGTLLRHVETIGIVGQQVVEIVSGLRIIDRVLLVLKERKVGTLTCGGILMIIENLRHGGGHTSRYTVSTTRILRAKRIVGLPLVPLRLHEVAHRRLAVAGHTHRTMRRSHGAIVELLLGHREVPRQCGVVGGKQVVGRIAHHRRVGVVVGDDDEAAVVVAHDGIRLGGRKLLQFGRHLAGSHRALHGGRRNEALGDAGDVLGRTLLSGGRNEGGRER